MKNIQIFKAEKYADGGNYKKVDENIYQLGDKFFTSLSFEQEPELEEGENAADISQYPLEDVLDKFYVYVSDFYEELNTEDSNTCYLEFGGSDAKFVKELLSIVGRHVYNNVIIENDEEYVELVID